MNKINTVSKQPRWLTKDRFWNILFWLGLSGGFSLATFVKFTLNLPSFTPYILILNIILLPTLIMYFNKTSTYKKRIVNSENIKLKAKQYPSAWVIPLTIISIPLSGFIGDKYATIGDTTSTFLFFLGTFSGLCLHFIYKNCPITILFNRNFWGLVFAGSSECSDNVTSNINRRKNNYYTDMVYSHTNRANIHNRHR